MYREMQVDNSAPRQARSVIRAVTLVEALLASTILAIVAASASLPFVAVAQQTLGAAELETAVELGEELMEEALARPFYAPGETVPSLGPEAEETERRLFDAADDFAGYTEYRGAAVRQHLTDYKGTLVTETDMNEFWRSVVVDYVRLPDQAPADSDDAFVRITVNVYRGNRLIVTLVRVKTREY